MQVAGGSSQGGHVWMSCKAEWAGAWHSPGSEVPMLRGIGIYSECIEQPWRRSLNTDPLGFGVEAGVSGEAEVGLLHCRAVGGGGEDDHTHTRKPRRGLRCGCSVCHPGRPRNLQSSTCCFQPTVRQVFAGQHRSPGQCGGIGSCVTVWLMQAVREAVEG